MLNSGCLLADLGSKTRTDLDSQRGRPGRSHLGIPRQNHVLSTVAEAFGGPIREAITCVERALLREHVGPVRAEAYGLRWPAPAPSIYRSDAELAAWSIVATWVLSVVSGVMPPTSSLSDAEGWFFEGQSAASITALMSKRATADAEAKLRLSFDRTAFAELLPYILDPHGPGSRLSVRRRPETHSARKQKRAAGVFYTPVDVAEYIAAEAFRDLAEGTNPITVLDPACGTGVFLRAALSKLLERCPGADAFDLSCTCLYGFDIDPWALDAAAFVLLHDCLPTLRYRSIPPAAAWHAIRTNLSSVDVLHVDRADDAPAELSRMRLDLRARLCAGQMPPPTTVNCPAGPIPLGVLFPELSRGAQIVLGNPPYADIGPRGDFLGLCSRFETFAASPRPSADLYPLFLEQMIRLTSDGACAGGFVLPLSIAFGTGAQFVAARARVSRTPGNWRFAFFDREPHALFGEDVKTRSAIVLWTRTKVAQDVTVCTGPLRKWRGHSRIAMFREIAFTPVSCDIRPGIPKIDGPGQAIALAQLVDCL